jgi:transposase, IS5 family
VREKRNRQRTIFEVIGKHPGPQELEQMALVLEANPAILDLAFDDLTGGRRTDTGRKGMTAEQVLRCAILKQARELTYEDLEFWLTDSHSLRSFCKLREGQFPSTSTLQSNIKSLREETWMTIHQFVISYADEEKLEQGRKIRLDSTVVESNIHGPSDSTLLWDGVRVMTRLLFAGKTLSPQPGYSFSDHRRVVKKRLFSIQNTKSKKVREAAYKDMLRYAYQACDYGKNAAIALSEYQGGSDPLDVIRARNLADEILKVVNLLRKVMDQTQRRVLNKEKVPASEKVVSLFETHTDIIVKGNRDTEYGHKIFVVGGVSNLILDCLVKRGNPADSACFKELLDRQVDYYGRHPRQSTADGGFASKENLGYAKSNCVKDAVFSKKRGLSIEEMAKSNWVFRRLKNFRAGIEANISTLKRAYGLTRCNWRGWEGFKQYVWSAIVSYNLLTIARIKLART